MKKIIKIKSIFIKKNSETIFNLNTNHFQIDSNSLNLIWSEIKLFSVTKNKTLYGNVFIQYNDTSISVNQSNVVLNELYDFILKSYEDLIYYYETTFITDITIKFSN